MNKELKPCPFCGGEAILKTGFAQYEDVVTLKYEIVCNMCGCKIERLGLEEYAINAWNTRKPIDNIVEQLEKCSWCTPPTYDEDGYCNDDSETVVDLETAIEIVKGGADNVNVD